MSYIHCDENAVYHACGYSNDNCIYLSLGIDSYLVTDSRYEIEARDVLSATKLVIGRDLLQQASKIISKSRIKKIKFDSKEWSHYAIKRLQSNTKCRWIEKIYLSHKRRIIKSNTEIELLADAVSMGASAFDNFATMIKTSGIGESEHSLQAMAIDAMQGSNGRSVSFDPIVAIGANAAKPHAHPTNKKLSMGDLLLVDAGVKHRRYCSDRTRTVRIGDDFEFDTSQEFSSKKLQKAYDAVLKAHDIAIKKARSGMKAHKIDGLARDVIEKAGFGKYFVHSTGHGVGLDIHEMPYISAHSKTSIEDGMVYTIEPGIYIPNKFGIRIEDMVVMRNGKAEIL